MARAGARRVGGSGKRSRSGPASSRPSWKRRAVHFVLGSAVGAFFGYGFAASSPGGAPSLLDPLVLKLAGGLGLVCGTIAASSPNRMWLHARGSHDPIREREAAERDL